MGKQSDPLLNPEQGMGVVNNGSTKGTIWGAYDDVPITHDAHPDRLPREGGPHAEHGAEPNGDDGDPPYPRSR